MGAVIYVLPHNWHYGRLFPNSIYAERIIMHIGGSLLCRDHVNSIRVYCTSKYYDKPHFTSSVCSRYFAFYYHREFLPHGATD